MNVIFDHVKDEAPAIVSFYFKPEKPVHYTAGQFIELTVPHEQPDERGTKRWFTLSSSPTDKYVSISTKLAEANGSTFKHALRNLQPGDQLHMSDPMGDFVLPKLVQTPIVFVAGGIGITPFHSMLGWLIVTGEQRPIRLLYAVAHEEDIVFQSAFKKAGVHATIVVSQPSAAWGGERGHLSAELILGLENLSDDTLVYISGPEPLVETLETELKQAGLKKEQLVLDFFPNYRDV